MRQVRSTRNTVHRSARPSRALVAGRAGGRRRLDRADALSRSRAGRAAADAAPQSRDARMPPPVRRPRRALHPRDRTRPRGHSARPAVAASARRPSGGRRGSSRDLHRPARRHRQPIAARFGLRTADVLALNGLGWSSIIYPGQVLQARRHAAAAPAPATPAPPVAACGAYTVQRGDTISAIAKRHGVIDQCGAVGQRARLVVDHLPRPDARDSRRRCARGIRSRPLLPPRRPLLPAPSAPAAGTLHDRGGRHDQLDRLAPRRQRRRGADRQQARLVLDHLPRPDAQDPVHPPPSDSRARAPSRSRTRSSSCGSGASWACRTAASRSPSAPRCRSRRSATSTWGDRDSLGLFQQRPSYGWGTEAEVQDPARATRAFFGGSGDPNGSRTRGLLDIPGWESLTFTQAAQAVQISAYPDAYAKWEQPAHAWLAALG